MSKSETKAHRFRRATRTAECGSVRSALSASNHACHRFGRSPALHGPTSIRDDLMRVDIASSREAQWQEATGNKPAVAPTVEAELVLIAVVGVAVQF